VLLEELPRELQEAAVGLEGPLLLLEIYILANQLAELANYEEMPVPSLQEQLIGHQPPASDDLQFSLLILLDNVPGKSSPVDGGLHRERGLT